MRLMSIHQAKGLEFPVVVVADLDRPRRGSTERWPSRRELGPMIGSAPRPSAATISSGSGEYDEEQAELARLLYVATTRAADYLILSSGLPEAGSAKGPWTELLGRHFDPLTGLRAMQKGTVPFSSDENRDSPRCLRVTSQEPPVGREAGRGGRAAKPRRPDREGPADGRPGRGTKTEVPGGRAARCSRAAGVFLLAAQRFLARPAGSDAACRGGGRRAQRAAAAGSPGTGHAGSCRAGPDRPGAAGRGGRAGPPPCPAAPRQHGGSDGDGLDEPIAWIQRLLASPRGAALAGAAESYRELEFLLAWPPGRPDPAGTCLQGFIDCLYRDASGGWHVIDYKTNRVAAGQLAAAAADYEMQMLVYGMAVEGILGRPPEELTLCFLRPGAGIPVRWDAASRQRAMAMVEEAMGRLRGGGT